MIKRLAHKYLSNDYYSIHIDSSENTEVINMLQIHLKKNKLTIVSQDSFLDSNEILKKLKKDIPVLLVFTGKKIINKKVLKEPDYIQKVLFNKEPDGYYIQEYSKDENILISIARKEDVDNYLNLFKKNNQTVLDFSLGPFILESLMLFMPEHEEIYTSGFKYNFNSGELFHNLDEKDTIGEDLRIGDDKIKNLSLLPFASFVCFFKQMDFFKNYGHFSQMQQESFIYKIIFLFLAKTILILFLILLATSYGLRTYYFGKSTEIQQEAVINSQVLDEIVTLKKDRDYKKNIISNTSLGSK